MAKTIRLINHNTGDVIEKRFVNNLVAQEHLSEFERSPFEPEVYYKETTEPGVYDRYDLEDES